MGCRLMKKQHTESTLQIPLAVSIILPSYKQTKSGQNIGLGLSSIQQDSRLNIQSNEIPQEVQEVIQGQEIHICLTNKRLLQMEDQIQNQRPIQNFQSPPMTGHMSFVQILNKTILMPRINYEKFFRNI
ncbi:hypothetical protein pb186bvf_016063 [Paramecium bursaria]